LTTYPGLQVTHTSSEITFLADSGSVCDAVIFEYQGSPSAGTEYISSTFIPDST